MTTCTIVGEFLGNRSDPCGQPATHTSVGRCDRGHIRSRPLCVVHAGIFQALPDNVFCAECDQDGIEAHMTITISEETDDPRPDRPYRRP